MLTKKKINDCIVTKAEVIGGDDPRPFRAETLFSDGYSNVFISAKKKSGKSTNIFFILKKIMSSKTKLILFVSTAYIDAIWKTIIKHFEDKGVEVEVHTSLFEDGQDLLLNQIAEWEQEAEAQKGGKKIPVHKFDHILSHADSQALLKQQGEAMKAAVLAYNNPEKKGKGKKKSKYKERSHVIVFDDLSSEIKTKSLTEFLKKSRHYKGQTIISSQYYLDIVPAARSQIDYMELYAGISEKKLQMMYHDADLHIEFEKFMTLYNDATSKKYSFLYVDTRNSTFRCQYDKQYEIPDDKAV